MDDKKREVWSLNKNRAVPIFLDRRQKAGGTESKNRAVPKNLNVVFCKLTSNCMKMTNKKIKDNMWKWNLWFYLFNPSTSNVIKLCLNNIQFWRNFARTITHFAALYRSVSPCCSKWDSMLGWHAMLLFAEIWKVAQRSQKLTTAIEWKGTGRRLLSTSKSLQFRVLASILIPCKFSRKVEQCLSFHDFSNADRRPGFSSAITIVLSFFTNKWRSSDIAGARPR